MVEKGYVWSQAYSGVEVSQGFLVLASQVLGFTLFIAGPSHSDFGSLLSFRSLGYGGHGEGTESVDRRMR